MITGQLEKISISSLRLPRDQDWPLIVTVDGKDYVAFTSSRIVLAILNTALLTGAKWKIQIDTESSKRRDVITRVRVIDDRESVCKQIVDNFPGDPPLRPLSPTAFAEIIPRKWGFFFAVGDKCKEYKGMNLDVYRVVEDAWLQEHLVVLTVDDNDNIVAAKPFIGD